MNTQTHLRILRPLCTAILLFTGLALAACNGTISSIGVPADSPWTSFSTAFQSSHEDLTVVTTGSNISAELLPLGAGAVCDSDLGMFPAECGTSACGVADCLDSPNLPEGAANVSFVAQSFRYVVQMTLDRPAFTAGGVQVESATAGTLGAISLIVSPGAGLSVGAGFSDGLVPMSAGQPLLLSADDLGGLLMTPHWGGFEEALLCTDGTSSCDPGQDPETLVAVCSRGPASAEEEEGQDQFLFRVDTAPGTYSLTCGSVPVTLTIGPAFADVGTCISTLKAERCAGLTGQARAACNHTQIGVCHATFNISSAHNIPPPEH